MAGLLVHAKARRLDVRRNTVRADRAASVGVDWRFGGTHDKGRVLHGLPAIGRPVTVRGFTLMTVERERFMLRRYVDWVGLYAQLGLTMNWRVPVPNPPVSTETAP